MRKAALVGILLIIIGVVFVLFGGLTLGGIGVSSYLPAVPLIYEIAHTPPLQPIYFAGLILIGIILLAIGRRR